ncbi:MAG TPA: ABC transporter ATP-binding protein [Ignavibacteriales bacterium]|nr:ABC transporter ATP-binding protein [Ignavibacteriales bacterium]HOL80297.1 ABC transporter ATP-binding protein [Ignavibacteriales bacterium]HOM64576.1 ABC transporter ATP-binding protein [Ignavibacteriales bacterium]HPD66673.1 ABC transporter ATP-binding protein [Ignavibacteriales bacterium]HPP32486.1 ABC transporter ATP-binding protein [Ignavibacteriales bacterium]
MEITKDVGYSKISGKKLFFRLLKFTKPYKHIVILAILFNILLSAITPLRPYLSKIAVDDYILKNNFNGLLIISLIILVSIFINALFQYLLSYITQLLGQKIVYNIRTLIFSHLQKLRTVNFDKTPVGRMVTRVTNDVESLNELFSAGIIQIFSDIFLILWIIAFMLYIDVNLTLISLSVIPLIMIASFIFKKKAREAFSNVRLHLGRLNTFAQEHFSGILVIKSFNKYQDISNKFKEINKDHTKANIDSIFYYAVFFPFVEFLGAILISLILWYSYYELLSAKLTLGTLFAFVQLTEMFFRPIRELSEKYNILQTAIASSERIFMLLDNNDTEQTITQVNSSKPYFNTIEFRNVWFAYENENWILKNVSFTVNKGEIVAIVGHTGAGKSTIINLLLRFYDIQKGDILIDGKSIYEYDLQDLRTYISIVLQDVQLFTSTIYDNISLGKDINIEDIKILAKELGLYEVFHNFENILFDNLEEKGSTLSLGQKQLITFVRALAHKPKLLLLDEATSNIDSNTEIIIQKAMDKLFHKQTSIVIAHRLSTIKKSTKIIVLHKGEVKEIGTHKDLILKKGLYYKLYMLQFSSK